MKFVRYLATKRADYGEALQAYYANGTPPNWQDSFVSAYATAHPWEDFAETWAHYLHIVDTLEMARAFGMNVHPRIDKVGELNAHIDFDPYVACFSQIIDAWVPLSVALNSLNRTMGQPDLYPFVLSAPAIEKLEFIHELVQSARSNNETRETITPSRDKDGLAGTISTSDAIPTNVITAAGNAAWRSVANRPSSDGTVFIA